ncbi:hypothetical protein [Allorhodopirellula solitaria]|uniref:Uncharacterized protein n=1 Tax=Allorhodopirellula solitaria TaxID=2527987 RepID=A0A5C5YF01_9BACT|nr:hypothetical protein [Allorhodopirellula solitaria]TWT74306.1 hypothetical protein CA85_11930 [Allorhodopirellula solitaria]
MLWKHSEPKPVQTSIQLDDDGFTIRGSNAARVDWITVSRIVAYKVDLWDVDLICIAFTLESEEVSIETTEADHGWKPMIAELENRFDVSDDWWSKVAFPAFEGNWTILWARSR